MKAVPSQNINEVLSWLIDKIKQDKKPTINEETRQNQIEQFETLKLLLLDFQMEVPDQKITNMETKLRDLNNGLN